MAKTVNVRTQQKHDLEKNWMKATGFTPKSGEIIVYDAEVSENDITHTDGSKIRDYLIKVPRIKIGDGETLVNDLEFASCPQVQLVTWEEDD